MKTLVTGGAGFIGSHLVEELIRRKHKVIVLDNLSTGSLKNLKAVKNKIQFVKCDLSKKKNLSKLFYKVDYVFHLAGLVDVVKSIKNPNKYYNHNVNSTLNVLNSSYKAKVRKFIYAASASCYGNAKKIPVSEKTKIQILSPYALTKWFSEMLIMRWVKVYNFKALSLRFFNVYGPRSQNSGSYSAVINIFMKQKFLKKPYTVVGDGSQTRSFVHVYDVVNAIIRAANSKISGEIFNVGSKRSIKINEITDILGGKKIYISKRKGELKHSSANIKKIKKKLNWTPKIRIKDGLRMLLDEFE